MKTALYRHFDADGRLLYVGISSSHLERLSQHMQGSHWSQDISRIEVEWHVTHFAAHQAEVAAIINEKPLHNIQHAAKSEAAALIGLLGASNVAEAVGCGVTAVSNASVRGRIPCGWYFILKDMADAKGIACSTSAFGFRPVREPAE